MRRFSACCQLLGLAVCAAALASGQNLSVNPGNLAFQVQQGGSAPPAQLLLVTSNPSGQGFAAQVQTGIVGNNWLQLDRTNGTTPESIAVTIDPTSLGLGQRSANVIVSLNGTEESVVIAVTVVVSTDGGGGGTDNPSIGFEPGALTFGVSAQGLNPPPQAMAVRNTGTGTLSYALEAIYPGGGPTGWIQLSSTFGTSSGSPSTHQVSADVTGLAAGQFSATIRITGNAANSPRNLPVSLTVGSAPTILLEPGSLEFSGFEGGTSSATQTLSISSAGTSGLAYQVTTNQPWLTVFPSSGNTDTGARLHDVDVDLSGLTPGTFLGLVSVESESAANSPQIALVTLTVHPPGLLSASPNSFSFFGPRGIPIREKRLVSLFSSSLQGFSWTATVSPPEATWLRLSPAEGGVPGNLFVEVDNTGLAAGEKTAEIHITPVPTPVSTPALTGASPLTTSGSPAAPVPQSTPALVIPVGLTLQSQSPVLGAAPAGLSFTASETSAQIIDKNLVVKNNGGPELGWTAIPETENGVAWLSIFPPDGIAPTLTRISVNTSGLAAGIHQGRIAIEAGPQKLSVPVTLVVSPQGGVLSTVQSGVLFDTVEDGGSLASEGIRVLNTGTDTLLWNAAVVDPAGAVAWLSVTPETRPAFPMSLGAPPARMTLSPSPSGLTAGTYTAVVEVDSDSQSPSRFLTAVLNVRAASATPALDISPGGLFFASSGSAVPSQFLAISRNRGGQLGFQAAASTFDSESWLAVTPTSDTTSESGNATLTVDVSPEGLPGGVYQGLISVTLGSGIVQSVPVSLLQIVRSARPLDITLRVSAADLFGQFVAPDSGCFPSGAHLAPVSLFHHEAVLAGYPARIEVVLRDAVFGTIVSDGSVLAEFSNGDPAMHLNHDGNGPYVGTWVPRSASPQVNLHLTGTAGPWTDETTIVVNVTSTSAPILSRGGTVNGASFAPGEPLASGGIISSFGINLAPGIFTATATPLPNSLAGLTLLAGGRPAPLYFAGAGQVNAQLPFETAPGVTQLIARVNGRHSVPQEAIVAAARPGVFAVVSSSGPARAIAQNQDLSLNTPDNPAFRGEALILYLTGLGAVSPPVISGAAAPSVEPLARADLEATATIGEAAADIFFLGLTPDFVGLGQANILIPVDAPIGPEVPIVVTIDGQPSNFAVVAIADQP